MANYFDVTLWALIGGLFSLVGGIILLSWSKLAHSLARYATPFAAGALLGAAFFAILPEAVEMEGGAVVFCFALIGIILFFILEHYLNWFHHHHEHDHGTFVRKPTTALIIVGDTLHNAIDGIAIGAAFLISPPVGIATAIAVAAHEIPQEIGDFGILLKNGMRRLRVLFWNGMSSLATVIAALLTFWLGTTEHFPLAAILGLAAGMFIYIAASDLIPTIHHEAKGKFAHMSLLLLVLGALLVGGISEYSHQQLHEATESREASSTRDTHEDTH